MALLPVPDAVQQIVATARSCGAEACELIEALGRVLASDVHAPVDVPPWHNSAMDGFAVRAADTSEQGVRLRINESVRAGQAPVLPVLPGTATVVMTGAPVPEGADAVVIVEHSDGARAGEVRLTGRVEVGENVRRRGSDLARGARVLVAGEVLNPASLGLLASLGLSEVTVARRPRVAVLSTGDELRAPGDALLPGTIYASNDVTLGALVREAGAALDLRLHAPDRLDALTEALERCLQADVVLTTGGVSVGDHDHVKAAMEAVGARLQLWKVKMKPGKPLAFGLVERDGRQVPIFGLPGNPVSCFVNFLQFVRPWLRVAMGDPAPYLPVVGCVAGEPMKDKPGRARLERVELHEAAHGWVARRSGSQSSGVLSAVARAHGLLLVDADEAGPDAGDPVRVQLFNASFLARGEPGYGW
jgi:molybdopterin molybdotransferase